MYARVTLLKYSRHHRHVLLVRVGACAVVTRLQSFPTQESLGTRLSPACDSPSAGSWIVYVQILKIFDRYGH